MVTKSRLRIFNKDLCLSQTKRKRRQERNDSKKKANLLGKVFIKNVIIVDLVKLQMY